MSENARENLAHISECLAELPANALELAVARLEGFTEGFAAGQSHAQNRSA
jgi:hypothetical protein